MCVFQPTCAFWESVLANLIPDLGIALLGFMVAWRTGLLQLVRQRKDEKRAEITKTIRYLELLQDDAKDMPATLSDWVEYLNNNAWVIVPATLWDTLQSSDELLRLLSPKLLSTLAEFYGHISNARQMGYSMMTALDQKYSALGEGALNSVKSAQKLQTRLSAEIESEIQRLKKRRKNPLEVESQNA